MMFDTAGTPWSTQSGLEVGSPQGPAACANPGAASAPRAMRRTSSRFIGGSPLSSKDARQPPLNRETLSYNQGRAVVQAKPHYRTAGVMRGRDGEAATARTGERFAANGRYNVVELLAKAGPRSRRSLEPATMRGGKQEGVSQGKPRRFPCERFPLRFIQRRV